MGAARRFVLLGAPGVGKGTYGVRLSQWTGLPHIATGDLIRDEIRKGTAMGKLCAGFVNRGELVPDECSTFLLRWKLLAADGGYILDGYPRRDTQIKLLESVSRPDSAILFTLRDDVLVQKSVSRRMCPGCGANYNIADINEGEIVMPALAPQRPGVCDKCGDNLYQRDDDKLETVKRRLAIHKEISQPVIAWYKEHGRLYDFPVNGSPTVTWPILQEWFLDRFGYSPSQLPLQENFNL